MMVTFFLALLASSAMLTAIMAQQPQELKVNITILHSATAEGAVCLDGSPPAYHLDQGYGSGLLSWIIVVDGGGWCSSISDCQHRSNSGLGSSTNTLPPQVTFSGILHDDSRINPDFYNWNRVRVRYCDGSSFTGDVEDVDPDTKLYYRGARIFRAIMNDLSRKGMQTAENAILTGTSAGGLATILNCDKFKSLLPDDARVKCVADAAFFINAKAISGTLDIQDEYRRVVTLHGSAKNLPLSCTSIMEPSLCFFPRNVVPYVQTPFFIINSHYDSWLVTFWSLNSEYLDPQHIWKHCKSHISNCTFIQRMIIQGYGVEFLKAFLGLTPSFTRGYFITSCYSHGEIVWTSYWFSPTSPRVLNKTIAEAVADWYFDRAGFHQYIHPYPCARDCALSTS
ncbi:PREDICTED: pectin acetylesterase 8-like isoform X3 [Nicotiana attenuata]|uniref:pectin acetylesterase 8-like isoform X3 n=1 Tax=Nicotiana attenuata TaxID=49451 RepID=UPI000904B00D|nr:PREDICTED: pectin acetylesterase 8-like isoform X3 [Nicotiana attenuata]